MVVSIRDVAARAGVSVGTVSNVLNRPDAVSPATVERVREAISDLGYVRNDAARQLRAGRSRSVGLVVLDSANPFFAEVSRGAEEEAASHGLAVLVGNSDERPERDLEVDFVVGHIDARRVVDRVGVQAAPGEGEGRTPFARAPLTAASSLATSASSVSAPRPVSR